VLVTGANGVGKTNLLEALHVGSQGFSPRTRNERRLVRFEREAARVSLRGSRRGVDVETEVLVRRSDGKRARLNGADLASAETLRSELAALVFTPDRLAIVKGPPAVRRAFLDRTVGRLFPAEAALPGEYGQALAQRNASLRLVRAGRSSPEALAPWTSSLAVLGTAVDAARSRAIEELAPVFADEAAALGLVAASLRYEGNGLTVQELDARLEGDLERGATGAGPHLRDVFIGGGPRELRTFGSQGEQRTAVLALTLAEASLLANRRGEPPLLLLDDVLSELDAERRLALLESLPPGGQTVVTATTRDALPRAALEPSLVVVVTPASAQPA
jgi:DNA replication and repair protein RecF